APAALSAAVRVAASRYGVPRRLLLAMAWVNTHDLMPVGHSPDGGWGVMQIVERGDRNQLAAAAGLTGLPPSVIGDDERATVLAGAALLRRLAGAPHSFDGWYGAVARYGGGRLFADSVFAVAGRTWAGRDEARRLAASPAGIAMPPLIAHYT